MTLGAWIEIEQDMLSALAEQRLLAVETWIEMRSSYAFSVGRQVFAWRQGRGLKSHHVFGAGRPAFDRYEGVD